MDLDNAERRHFLRTRFQSAEESWHDVWRHVFRIADRGLALEGDCRRRYRDPWHERNALWDCDRERNVGVRFDVPGFPGVASRDHIKIVIVHHVIDPSRACLTA